MRTFIIRRLLLIIPMMIGVTLVSFFIMHLPPGDPVELLNDLNPDSSPQSIARMREIYHLDDPLVVQYFRWLAQVVTLDFGTSFSPDARPVLDKIIERLPVTLVINILATAIILILAIPIGVISATRPYSFFDKATTLFVFLGFAMPTFWLALLLMILFGVWLEWLPISGLQSFNHDQLSPWGQFVDYARHLLLPVLVSGLTSLAGLSRFTRQNMLEVIRQDYVTTARAMGIPESRVIYRYSLKNALLPVVTIVALMIPGLIGGSVIFEQIYAIPGAGQLFYQAVMMRDYPLVMASFVIGAFLTLISTLIADVAYAFVDPRISYD
jgi:peptide/nickel transport system permease protein